MSISLHPDTPEGRTLAAPPVAGAAPEARPGYRKFRSRLFTKYVALFVAVVGVALLSNGIFEVFFYYREHKAALIRIQHEQAEAAAAKIGQFIKEIESQLGWTTQLPWSAGSIEQRRFDALRLLRQVPAITELAQVDASGKERLRVSRLAMDVVDSGLDLSKEPKFTEAVAHKVYYGPVYFRRESEPYMTLSLAGTRKDAGVSIAEVNLKLIWDVVSQIKVGEGGHAYVVGEQGRLIAHPDISLVLRNTDMSKLAQVQAARLGPAAANTEETRNIQGQEVLTASAPIPPLGWTMFVELPVEEAYASLYEALQRLAVVLLGASIFAVLAGVFLARRMVGPIQALSAGAERIGGGDFTQRISIHTGDELEGLANQFNDMGVRLQESYADLEKKVERRTAELSESLEHQTATAEILSSISGSMTDTKPVFDAIVRNLLRLFSTRFAVVQTLHDGIVEMPAVDGEPGFERLIDRYPRSLADDTVGGQVMLSKRTIQFSPVLGNPAAPATTQQFARDFGFDSVIFTPMLLGDKVVGAIGVARHEPVGFDEKQIALIGAFANQAVIAIENTRLLRELRQRTDDLSESLQHQTATSEVLQVISRSPGELDPVFQTILASATAICDAQFGLLVLYEDGGFRCTSTFHLPPAFAETFLRNPVIYPPPSDPLGRVISTRQLVHVADVRQEPDYVAGFPPIVELAELGGARTLLLVPMLKESSLGGVIAIFRQTIHPFSGKQIDLVTSFASQAVIAIENARLLSELRLRTDDLSESLQQQTATADVLRVISSSPGELEPVFEALLANATRICGASFGNLFMFSEGAFRAVAVHNAPAAYVEARMGVPIYPGPDMALSRVMQTKQAAQVEDLRAVPGYIARDPQIVAGVELAGVRTMLAVPMLKEEELIGTINIYRQEVRTFTDKQVQLVQNFANQAVIAIENARLLQELRQRTDDLSESLQQQTATADVLKVISRSAFDLDSVLATLLASAAKLCEAETGVIFLHEQDNYRLVANYGFTPEFEAFARANPYPTDGGSTTTRAVESGTALQVVDVLADETRGPLAREYQRRGGYRTNLGVPLRREGQTVGVFMLARQVVRAFSPRQIELVETFADQAVIAIENARLFQQVQQRTRELSLSLEDLRTAQDRLVQTEKLASLGQLTAGIAHEIKNPLNFVNNFSALSAELIDELNDVLKPAALDDKTREEIDELTHMLKGNLEKVVQHGKRADSIVKNMLLHSREGSGEHRPVDINAIVEESLNLAYHGARAEKSGFNITLQRDLDPAAGLVDLYPQEITRVFLNLISNGFYAAAKRKEAGDESFEPTLSATTKNLGNKVEIRIRDNGTGIPLEVKEKMFNPFFTTKPAGEGTGLGLSMSHDIVVKQHGGKIDVDTEPGAFTEFIITLPRTAAAQANIGGKN